MIFNKKILILSIIFTTIFIIKPIFGELVNPSMSYCEELGYEFSTIETDEGEQGICKFPDDSICEAWNFLKGKCGEEYSYCVQQGYEMKTISDIDKCSSIFSTECAVCVLENKTEIEVSQLMEIDFGVGSCGDGSCSIEESYENCPQDCSSGAFDLYCDGVSDGICDPDCTEETDPDCITTTTQVTTTTIPTEKPSKIIWYILAGVVIIVLVFFFVYQMKNQPQQQSQQISY